MRTVEISRRLGRYTREHMVSSMFLLAAVGAGSGGVHFLSEFFQSAPNDKDSLYHTELDLRREIQDLHSINDDLPRTRVAQAVELLEDEIVDIQSDPNYQESKDAVSHEENQVFLGVGALVGGGLLLASARGAFKLEARNYRM